VIHGFPDWNSQGICETPAVLTHAGFTCDFDNDGVFAGVVPCLGLNCFVASFDFEDVGLGATLTFEGYPDAVICEG